MTEMDRNASAPLTEMKQPGRFAQTWICFRDAMWMFFHHRSWLVIPMGILLAAFVGYFMKDDFRISMEGTLKGVFVLTCICIWNGCFSSIQAISREREENVPQYCPGRYPSAYAFGHILFQLLISVLHTVILLLILRIYGVEMGGSGVITGRFWADFAITLLLITFAADITALWISSFCRTTKASMTILPFVLVFEILLSGTMLQLPEMLDPVSFITISRPGINSLGAISELNSQPYATVAEVIAQIEDTELSGHVTVGQVMDILTDRDNKTVEKVRNVKVGGIKTIGEVMEILLEDRRLQEVRDTRIVAGLTFGTLLSELDDTQILDDYKDREVGMELTVGEIVDAIAQNRQLQGFRDEGITFKTTPGDLMGLMGKEKTLKLIEDQVASASYDPDYEPTVDNVRANWIHLVVFIAIFVTLILITIMIAARIKQKKQTEQTNRTEQADRTEQTDRTEQADRTEQTDPGHS